MPRVAPSPFAKMPEVSEWDLLMAAATMDEQGLLIEPEETLEREAPKYTNPSPEASSE